MAVGPKHLDAKFLEEVALLEAQIDAALLKKSLSPGGAITIASPSSLTGAHLKILTERYIEAGWTSIKRYLGDQRDPGDYLTFQS